MRKFRGQFYGLVLLAFALFGWLYPRYFKPDALKPERAQSTPSAGRAEYSAPTSGDVPAHQPSNPLLRDVVVRVSDGDTVKLKSGGKVRLIGVDCPELHQRGGKQASDFTRSALLGKTIEIETCGKEPRDRYGRRLGFIWLPGPGGDRVLFNSELVRQGYARTLLISPCVAGEPLWTEYYQSAKDNHRGLFASLGEVPDPAAFRREERKRR